MAAETVQEGFLGHLAAVADLHSAQGVTFAAAARRFPSCRTCLVKSTPNNPPIGEIVIETSDERKAETVGGGGMERERATNYPSGTRIPTDEMRSILPFFFFNSNKWKGHLLVHTRLRQVRSMHVHPMCVVVVVVVSGWVVRRPRRQELLESPHSGCLPLLDAVADDPDAQDDKSERASRGGRNGGAYGGEKEREMCVLAEFVTYSWP
jgi:hypothetical protein